MKKTQAQEHLRKARDSLCGQKFKGKAAIERRIRNAIMFMEQYKLEERNIDLMVAEIDSLLAVREWSKTEQ